MVDKQLAARRLWSLDSAPWFLLAFQIPQPHDVLSHDHLPRLLQVVSIFSLPVRGRVPNADSCNIITKCNFEEQMLGRAACLAPLSDARCAHSLVVGP